MIDLKGLAKRFGSMTAVDGLDIKTHPGDLFAMIPRRITPRTTRIGTMKLVSPPLILTPCPCCGAAWYRC